MANRVFSLFIMMIFLLGFGYSQTPVRTLLAKKITDTIKIDGDLSEPVWFTAQPAKDFTMLNPAPFVPESKENASEVYFLYDDKGIYIGGFFHEKNKDSIATELIGRDGFGNNDFVGVIFDTYHDKLNGFEYFLTPLSEQWDAKMTYGGTEDFTWNAVWKGASKIKSNGWSFEIFIPFSAIRYGREKNQTWGVNIVRYRLKSGQKSFWQSIDPNVNGFLSQEGILKGLENIKPPLRLQFSPYFSTYLNHDGNISEPSLRNSNPANGGMDIKYGINQSFTLDMTLVPDFGQVQTDNMILNLTPFEQQFSENRTFFTEGTELFSKGGLFYSRRIGGKPLHFSDAYSQKDIYDSTETVIKNPEQSKLINATKFSGRTQKGLGIGMLNAITKPQYAMLENSLHESSKFQTDPLTNYNVFVLDQTLKHNSSISLVNTNVSRSGKNYNADVSSLLFDLNDKTNTWNIGGSVGTSAIFNSVNKNIIGYTHSIYFGKTSGRLNYNYWQNLINGDYNKSDLGYLTNNNTLDQGVWVGYKWTKPKGWYNQIHLNLNISNTRLVSQLDILKRKNLMNKSSTFNVNGNVQFKNLWQAGGTLNIVSDLNDYYEPRDDGRFFHNKGNESLYLWWNSNSSKKLSWGGNFTVATGGVFNYKTYNGGLFGNIHISNKFSINPSIYVENSTNQTGWADLIKSNLGNLYDTVTFSRRNLHTVENILNIKYNFTNKMGLTLRIRHYWSKVDPKQFYTLNTSGNLEDPVIPFTKNVKENYNFLSFDMLFNWQFAQGSFLNFAWKDIGNNFNSEFEKNYFDNFGKIISGPQYRSFSLSVIYFLDYLTLKKSLKRS